jgi:molecular chaperone DnaJ
MRVDSRYCLSCELRCLPSAAGSREGPAAQKAENPTATVTERTEKAEDQNDVWNKLKDFAG